MVNYVPVGCYEPTATGLEVACSCAGRINILKAVESAMCGGVDNLSGKQIGLPTKTVFHDFEDFYDTVKQQLACYIDGSMELFREYESSICKSVPVRFFRLHCWIVWNGVDLMRTNQLSAIQLEDFHLIRDGYGYGLAVRTHMCPAESESLSPIGEFGWDGAAGAFALIDPEHKLSLVFFQHIHNWNRIYQKELTNALYCDYLEK